MTVADAAPIPCFASLRSQSKTLQEESTDWLLVAPKVRLDKSLEPLINPNPDLSLIGTLFGDFISTFAPRVESYLEERNMIQGSLDSMKVPLTAQDEVAFYREIGYIQQQQSCSESLKTHDQFMHEELLISGPQLVVPLDNLRFSINAVNSRWKSLYDCLFSSDLMPKAHSAEEKANLTVKMTMDKLDEWFPLAGFKWADGWTGDPFSLMESFKGHYKINGHFDIDTVAVGQFEGVIEWLEKGIYFEHHGLGVRVVISDKQRDLVSLTHPMGIIDVLLESVPTVILDAEDSAAAFDTAEKKALYRNYEAILNKTATVEFKRNDGQTVSRVLEQDKVATLRLPDGTTVTKRFQGCAAVTLRISGMAITTDIVQRLKPAPGGWVSVPEILLDLFITVRIWALSPAEVRGKALHVILPKCHTAAEIALCVEMFCWLENKLGLPSPSIVCGIMDEERRLSFNLERAVAAAAGRAFFVNTGFLDRTGDEIYSLRKLGIFLPRSSIKSASWLSCYEERNVVIGHKYRVPQIGKGMWAEPNNMERMMALKSSHVLSGATTAWVPSPSAACLHAMHWHDIAPSKRFQPTEDVSTEKLLEGLCGKCFMSEAQVARIRTEPDFALLQGNEDKEGQRMSILNRLGCIGDLTSKEKTLPESIELEVIECVVCIVYYTARWINLGVGCSTVPDVHGVGLMEDRATLRISAQLLGNWLLHGVISASFVESAIDVISDKLNSENAADSEFISVSKGTCALDAITTLCLRSSDNDGRYTEAVLRYYRMLFKSQAQQKVK